MRLPAYSCAACRLCASTCGRRYHQHALLGHRNDRVRLPVVLCVLLLFRRCVAAPGTATHACTSSCSLAKCCNRVVTHLSDPGIVPRDWMIKDLPETEYSKKLLLPEGRSASCLQLVPSRAGSSPCVVTAGRACDHVCRTCNIVRPRLSHHCSMCDHCVVGFDHHCSWLGVCIGHRNRKHFLMLLATWYVARHPRVVPACCH